MSLGGLSTAPVAKDGLETAKRIRPPKYEKVIWPSIATTTMLYYKRLEPEAFVILTALSRGVTVEDTCAEALYIP